jgi:hypothetical protein
MTRAIYPDATGELASNRAMDLYKPEENTRRIFDGCVAFGCCSRPGSARCARNMSRS